MDEKEMLNKIKEIVYAVPDELYKCQKPDEYWDDEDWAKLPPIEKGFIFIKELLENNDIKNHKEAESKNINSIDEKELHLGEAPTFWTQADENMFFTAIYSMASYSKIKGQGKELYLYYQGQMSNEEKKFLTGLLKRYGMRIPKEIQ